VQALLSEQLHFGLNGVCGAGTVPGDGICGRSRKETAMKRWWFLVALLALALATGRRRNRTSGVVWQPDRDWVVAIGKFEKDTGIKVQ
jgi:hypothetical protein